MGKKDKVVVEEEAEEVEEPKAKKAKKEKKAAKEAVEVEEEEAVPAPEKKKKKKKAAEEEAVEEEEAVPAPEKKKKKKKAAEEEAVEEEEAAPEKKKKKKKAAEEDAEKVEEEEAAPAPVKEKKVEKKEEPKKDGEEEEWKDITSHCVDCDKDFEFTAGEQEFLFSKGFDVMAKRCKDCKWAKKNGGKDGGGKDGKGKGKDGGKGDNENTVFVRGLPFATTQEALEKDFAECGEIVRCNMPLNEEGQARGIAFIKYTTKEGMDKACAFDNTDYGGRYLNVAPAGDGPPKGKGKDGKDGKGKDGKGKDGKGKGKKGKGKGKAPSESFSKSTGAILESTGKKETFAESDDE